MYRAIAMYQNGNIVSTSLFSISMSLLQYANVGPMAITLCQTLGQNIGMMWNKQRPAAGDPPPPGPHGTCC